MYQKLEPEIKDLKTGFKKNDLQFKIYEELIKKIITDMQHAKNIND